MRQHVMPPLVLDRAADLSLAAQLYGQLRAALDSGALRPGERMPSSRVLAQHLAVSRIVVTDVYQRLTAEGRLEGQHGSGTFVARQPVPAVPARPEPQGSPGPEVIDLRPGTPWVAGYDQAAWRRAWRAAGDLPPVARPDRYGAPDLRAHLAEHLRRSRAVPVRAEHLMVTRGTGHGLDLLVATVLAPGGRVGVEDPGYEKARNVLAARGARVVPVPVDEHGVIPDGLPDDLALLYTTPAHQYPLGGRLPPARRRALADWARGTGGLLVEDDYDAEFRYDVAPLPTLFSQAPEHVVLLGTLSKSLSPDLGLGWLIATPALLARIAARRYELSDRPPGAVQRAVATLMANGDLDRHLHRMRREYARRRAVIVGLLGERVRGEAAGLHVTVELPGELVGQVVARAAAQGILLDTLERHYAGTTPEIPAPDGSPVAGAPRRHGLVIGYGAADLERIERGCRILRDLIEG